MKWLKNIERTYYVDGKRLTEELKSDIKSGKVKAKVIYCKVEAMLNVEPFFEDIYNGNGKATCDDSDEFDLYKGMDLSYKKALYSIYNKISKRIDRFSSDLYKLAMKTNDIQELLWHDIFKLAKDVSDSTDGDVDLYDWYMMQYNKGNVRD